MEVSVEPTPYGVGTENADSGKPQADQDVITEGDVDVEEGEEDELADNGDGEADSHVDEGLGERAQAGLVAHFFPLEKAIKR